MPKKKDRATTARSFNNNLSQRKLLKKKDPSHEILFKYNHFTAFLVPKHELIMTAETLKPIFNALDASQKEVFIQWATSRKQTVKRSEYKSDFDFLKDPKNQEKLMMTLSTGGSLQDIVANG